MSSKTKELELPADIESCHILIRSLLSIIETQQRQLEQMASRIAELEVRLNQNSRNSSRPPSSDLFQNRPGIPKEPKVHGGQQDHTGKTLCQVDNPSHIVPLRTAICSCGNPLDPNSGVVVKKHQVFDLPQPKLEVTEYQVMEQKCTCGRVHRGQLPLGVVAAPVQYGAGVRALTVMLNNSCQLSFEKTSMLFKDLFGHDLNESTSVSNNKMAFEQLEAAENQIKEQLLSSKVLHADETGLKVSGKLNYWLHTTCNALFTYLFVSEKRGIKAHTDTVSILPAFKGWLLHDCYAFYFKFTQCLHGLCGPHLLRELQAQIEQEKAWATTLHATLLDLYKKSEKGRKTVPNMAIEKEKWLETCQNAIKLEELLLPITDPPDASQKKKRGRKKRGKALSLLDRLVKHSDAVLAFAEFETVPFSNNQAERDLRPAKTKQKVAGCFRTPDGANTYARIQGFISTCRKHQLNVFNELRAVCSTSNSYLAPFGR